MISVTETNDNFTIESFAIRPNIYLDHWALRSFSSNQNHRKNFFKLFDQRGTLMFSWLNFMEIVNNEGKSVEDIRAFLAEIGERWFLLDARPIKVIEKEHQWKPGENSPAFAAGFLIKYYPDIHRTGNLTLSVMADKAQDPLFKKKYLNTLEELKSDIKKAIEEIRKEWKTNPKLLNMRFLSTSFNPKHPTEFIYDRLMLLIMKENHFHLNDSVDLFHSVIPLAYCDFVLLDGHWANLASRINLPKGFVRSYCPKEIDKFFYDFENVRIENHVTTGAANLSPKKSEM